jgi:phosphoesterase RecJ-like protein
MNRRANMNYKEVLDIARNSDNIYITGHVNPDGDCIGAVLAMAMLLEEDGILAKVVLEKVSEVYDFLPIEKYVISEVNEDIDLLITLDCGDESRVLDFLKTSNTLINIDHHKSNNFFGKYNHVVVDTSSTCEIIYNMIDDKSKITKEIATSLYTGIVYDTGCFKHSNTSRNTHLIAGELIKFEFDFTEIINRLLYYKTVTALKARSIAVGNMKLHNDNKVITSFITLNDMKKLNAGKESTEGIVQMLNEIKGIECAVFAYEIDDDSYKVSLRSKGMIDVCKVAGIFGGGGHVKASGCSIKGNSTTVLNTVLAEINNQLDNN